MQTKAKPSNRKTKHVKHPAIPTFD